MINYQNIQNKLSEVKIESLNFMGKIVYSNKQYYVVFFDKTNTNKILLNEVIDNITEGVYKVVLDTYGMSYALKTIEEDFRNNPVNFILNIDHNISLDTAKSKVVILKDILDKALLLNIYYQIDVAYRKDFVDWITNNKDNLLSVDKINFNKLKEEIIVALNNIKDFSEFILLDNKNELIKKENEKKFIIRFEKYLKNNIASKDVLLAVLQQLKYELPKSCWNKLKKMEGLD